MLGKNIHLLIVGGSIGRGNYVNGWSDVDLLLVLMQPDSESLRLVRKCEEDIKKRFNIDVDTMITSKFTIEHTAPKKLHGKIKNFLFFLRDGKILIKKKMRLPRMDRRKFTYGFWATYAEQEKNFLRRNADIEWGNKQAMQILAKKNIKIIFLILKQYLAGLTYVPSTYKTVLSMGEDVLPEFILSKLREYETIRTNNGLSKMSIVRLRKIILESIKTFNYLGKFIIKNLTMYEKRN